MLCPWEAAKYLIFSSNVPILLYYSHIPAVFFALALGLYVYFNKKSALSKALLLLVSIFSLYVLLDLIIWATNESYLVIFLWSVQILLEPFIFLCALYVAYLFFEEKFFSPRKIFVFLILLVPFIFLIPTKYDLLGVRVATCDAQENPLIIYYSYALEIFFAVWTLVISIKSYIKRTKITEKRGIGFFGAGIILFLVAFSWGNIAGSFTEDWKIAQYGLFGMPIFMAFLAYLIVKYKAFNVKLLSTQALVFALIILIGSLFLVQDIFTIRIITAITLALTIVVGWQLVRSVKLEVKRKEELQELSNKLAVVNDKLHQLDKAKSEFISIASHQLRTPLTAIKGFVSLLLEGTYGEVPQTQRPALEKVYISNERLVQLVEDLLNISRMDAGRMEFDFQEAQIEDLVQEAVDTLELSAHQKDLYLNWQKPEIALPKLKIDITKIKEVISNMIDNAIKYTQKGGITVKVEKGSFYHHDHKETKNVMRIIVSDTGIGMDKDDIDMIFNKFQRGREVSHYHTDGTGLGMYIGKKVVEAHQGKIWAESAGKNQGSRFILELPIG